MPVPGKVVAHGAACSLLIEEEYTGLHNHTLHFCKGLECSQKCNVVRLPDPGCDSVPVGLSGAACMRTHKLLSLCWHVAAEG